MKKFLTSAAILIVTLLIYNCYSTHQITEAYELRYDKRPSKIFVFTKDSILYELDRYKLLDDSTLLGSGIKIINDKESNFDGEISIQNTKYILSKERDDLKTIIAAGIIGYVGISGISYLTDDKNFKIWPVVKYPVYSGGSSCPFIYSWGGDKFNLEGEAFGIGLSKSFEMKTSHILNSLNVNNPIAKIMLSNERPETHYFNHVSITALEVNKNEDVYTDVYNRFWAVENYINPVIACDFKGTNITKKLNYEDNDYWESDLANIKVNSEYEDVVKVKFLNNGSLKKGVLIIHSINTKLSEKVFEFLGGFLGNNVLEFYNSLESDPEMISIFKDWIKAVSLKAYVLKHNKLQEIGFVYPEANSIPFAKAIPFNFDEIEQDTTTIILKSLADVWKIDDVKLGVSENPNPKLIDISILTAKDHNQNTINELINFSDNKYKMLLPSENIEINFNTLIPSSGKKIIYALNAQGYLYEWMPDVSTKKEFQFAKLDATHKIEFLKSLIKNKSIFLPIIYSEWEKDKSKKIN